MVKLEEFYNKVKLPINDELLNKLLEKYFSIPLQKPNYEKELYNEINKTQKNVINSEKIKHDQKILFSKINQDFIKAGQPFNPDTHEGITNPIGVQTGWDTFKSWNLLGGERIPHNEQVHRLYISIASNDKMDFANELYDEFKHNNLPFYFKVDVFSEDRPDKVVIYTSTQLLEKTLMVLDNIFQRRPDLIKNCNPTSIITGQVTDKIGYASEIINQNNQTQENKSYTQIICAAFANAIKSITDEYYNNHNISNPIYELYQQRLEETKRLNLNLDDNIRKRIAFEILIQHDPDFKVKVLNAFRKNIQNAGLDPNNMCFSMEAKRQIQNQVRMNKKIDIFDPEILNEIITLPNGTELTIDEYLKRNRVWSLVPLDATVTIGISGKTISGKEFIAGVIKRATYHNNLEDLFKAYNVTINRKDNSTTITQNNNNEQNKKIKSYSLEEIEELITHYNLIKDNNGEYKVINRRTNIIYDAQEFVNKVKFAYTWMAATRYERSLENPDLKQVTPTDYTYAFNEEAKAVYNKIMTTVSQNMQTTGALIDPQILEKKLTNYTNYKYTKSIVRGLYSEERFKKSFENWVKMANNIPIIEENQTFRR